MTNKQTKRSKHLIKRFSALICAVAMVLCLIPTTVQAANATKGHDVIDTANDHLMIGIYADGDLNINLVGTNSVNGTYDANTINSYGICVYKIIAGDLSNLTIDGTGSLTVTGENNTFLFENVGIMATGGITINGGTITATGGKAGSLSAGIYSWFSDIIINGGTITATGSTAINGSIGILANTSVIINDGNVTAIGGTTTSINQSYSYGIDGYVGFSITGGTLYATGNTAAINKFTAEPAITPVNGSISYHADESALSAVTWDANSKQYYIGTDVVKTILIGRAPAVTPNPVNTGDNTSSLLWTGIAIISLLSLVAGIVIKQKKRQEN